MTTLPVDLLCNGRAYYKTVVEASILVAWSNFMTRLLHQPLSISCSVVLAQSMDIPPDAVRRLRVSTRCDVLISHHRTLCTSKPAPTRNQFTHSMTACQTPGSHCRPLRCSSNIIDGIVISVPPTVLLYRLTTLGNFLFDPASTTDIRFCKTSSQPLRLSGPLSPLFT